jgi:hypothetical protein
VPLANPNNVLKASLLIDHYLRRPEGCVYGVDANQQPAYMVSRSPSFVYSFSGVISPGTNVVVPLPGYVGDNDSLIGEVVVLDRLIAGSVEACVVLGVATGQVTLTNVQFTHTGTVTPVTLEFGMCVAEELNMPSQRSVARLSEWPIAKLMSGLGRYGYGRRTDQMLGYFYDANLLSTLSAFGGPPAWTPFTIGASSLNPETGDLWVPSGTLLAYYTTIKMRYVSGWSAATLPAQIKVAAASIVDALSAAPMGAQIRRFNAGKTQIERFAATVLDDDIKTMLRPFMANWMI